jgi:transcriptional regulator with XRE-family HTH domain
VISIEEALQRAADRRGSVLPTPALRRLLREDADLTQQDLADIVGVQRASIARYELSLREPRGEVRERYAEILRGLQRV